MENDEKTVPDHPWIKPEMQSLWKKHVAETINADPGEGRQYGLLVLGQIGLLISALHSGMAPSEVVKLVAPNTSLIMMKPIIKNLIVFSVRGEEFRTWWNEWHDRVHPGDVLPMPLDQMNDAQRTQWDRRWLLPEKDDQGRHLLDDNEQPKYVWQPPIFTPWHANIMGRSVVIPGSFDPSAPLTKTADYAQRVSDLYKKMKQEMAQAA